MTVSELKTNNPWRVVADKYDSGKSNCLFLEDGNTDYVHPEDLDRIIKFNSRNPDKEYCIVTNTPPEPWRGNPLTARLIILSLNPGYIPEINMTLATSRGSKKGVEVRLIHAKEPGPAFREDFDKHPALFDGLERALCPRVHFKILVFDGQMAYIGSANLTGAGIGMKGEGTRNFEAGILTDLPELVEQAMNQFDNVWIGKHCSRCKRKAFCGDPIDRSVS